MAKARILLIDDDLSTLDFLQFNLQSQGYEVETASLGGEGLAAFEAGGADLVLTDLRLPDMDGIEVLRAIKERSPDTEVIVISGYSSVDKAVEATKHGAFYFIEKPIETESLATLLDRALALQGKTQEVERLRGRLSKRTTYQQIVGGSKLMQDLYELIDNVAPSDANVLIIGESGTGKELIANAIHYKSNRNRKSYVSVNCAALPKELIESELFGHTKGAFTGANSDKSGFIAQANGGTLLLDEIAEMPIELQPKLLRVLQERVYYRLGSEKPQTADFRLIAATNRDPEEAIKSGLLREDLYYRVNTITIHVPPLRARADDIQMLAEHFLKIYAEKYARKLAGFTPEAYQAMFAHTWPGNVRELQSAIERAVLLARTERIEPQHLPFKQPASSFAAGAVGTNASAPSLQPPPLTESVPADSSVDGVSPATEAAQPETAGVEWRGSGEFSTVAPGSPPVPNYAAQDLSWDELGELIVNKVPTDTKQMSATDVFQQIEASIVKAALQRYNSNKQAVSNVLGVYRPRLYHMLKKHELK